MIISSTVTKYTFGREEDDGICVGSAAVILDVITDSQPDVRRASPKTVRAHVHQVPESGDDDHVPVLRPKAGRLARARARILACQILRP
jgi:hypothetical protein